MAYPVVTAYAERIWSSPRVTELYRVYLVAMNHVVRAAVPLMTAAIDHARLRAPDDPVATRLAEYLSHHISEESGHDVWLLEDLEVCGGDSAEALTRIPSPRVASLVGAQYYWLRHYHPVSLLGHIAAIEGNHPPAGFAKRLSALTGYPRTAFRAIEKHETLDIRHKQELYELIDILPLQPDHERMIGVSALHTIQSAIDVFAEIHDSSSK
jgi:hypothetical protein